MVCRNPVTPEPLGTCSRGLPEPEQASRYAWPQCAMVARAFARRAAALSRVPVPVTVTVTVIVNPPHKDEPNV